MKISFCTTCKGRLAHLKETLPVNLKAAEGFDCEFVIVDYDCQDGAFFWLRENIKDERVKSFISPNHPYYDSQHAKNIAHRLATGDILFNLDADNMITRELIEFVLKCFEDPNPRSPGICARPPYVVLRGGGSHGRYGQVAMKQEWFEELGGYDESLPPGWGADDEDIVERAQQLPLKLIRIPKELTHIIDHPPEMRMDNFPVKDWQASNQAKLAARSKQIVANAGKEWGKL